MCRTRAEVSLLGRCGRRRGALWSGGRFIVTFGGQAVFALVLVFRCQVYRRALCPLQNENNNENENKETSVVQIDRSADDITATAANSVQSKPKPLDPPPGESSLRLPPFPHLPPLATPKSNDTGHYPPSHPISGTPSDRYLQRTGNGMEWSGLNADTLLRRHVGHEPPPSAHHWTLTDTLVCPADFSPVRWMRRWFCVVICERVGEGFNGSSG